MNVYDFDHTIYDGDSSLDFYLYILRKKPSILRFLPSQFLGSIKYILGKSDTKNFKECFFSFLSETDNLADRVKDFWDKNEKKINKWYKKRDDDVIISASPEFLLAEICKRLGVKSLIATKMDTKTGKILGKNCKGEEKVALFLREYASVEIDCFYSDSSSDLPLARLAKKAYIVKSGKIREWQFETNI